MAKVIKRHRASDAGSGLPRKDRRSCDYEAYLPDPLVDREVVLDGRVAADVSEAEAARSLEEPHGDPAPRKPEAALAD